jgi:excisionase family DNA binding protein
MAYQIMSQTSCGLGKLGGRIAYSIDEVAELYGVSPSSVRRAIIRGDLVGVKFGKLLRVLDPAADRLPRAQFRGSKAA